ncbi:MOSC domain-containing protein [Dietzia kunjamensis]|uniref:MOSC domain-containing protein n=1 Tax=Dietzia kunjamensis TaxID=322509 RepID=UPI0023EEB537|nr:MOSC domain-containing protein [Dietzia kunjamensis]
MRVGRVAQLGRHPVKSMRGDRLHSAELTGPWGLPGDRGWVARGEDDGEPLSANKLSGLLGFHARYAEEPHSESTPTVEVTFPDGRVLRSDDDRVHDALSGALGARVRLCPRPPTPAGPDDDGAPPRGTYFDAMPLSLLTTTAMSTLQSALPDSAIDPRRFRTNLIVSTCADATGHPEFDRVGSRLHIGETTCEVVMRIPRCRMVTLPQADLPHDRTILRTSARDTDATLGVYLRAITPGTIREGDEVRLL